MSNPKYHPLPGNHPNPLKAPQYRNEWKFLCSEGQLALLKNSLNGVLYPDPHAAADGKYTVHSLYFDDMNNSCAAANESGASNRYKYRIRYYGGRGDLLFLERKEKHNGLGKKVSCTLTEEEYLALARGDAFSSFWNTEKELLKKFSSLMMLKHFEPKIIIDYERTAFVEPSANIRVTFDRKITSSCEVELFRKGGYSRFPVMSDNRSVLEVKFDAILPGWIRHLIENAGIHQQVTFSKYYLGRKQMEGILI